VRKSWCLNTHLHPWEIQMFQDDNTHWDPIHLWKPAGVFTQIYVLFALVAVIVTIVKLTRVWTGAPPFRLSRQAGNPQYIRLLEASRCSIRQWMGLAFLGWALVISHEVSRFGIYADESTRTGLYLLVTSIQGLGTFTELPVLLISFLFFAHWHMLNRVHLLHSCARNRSAPKE
jgi:hypothetical protein